jgi:hypothetical protein
MSELTTITGSLRYLAQAAALDAPSPSGQPTSFLLLIDFPPGGNSIPTQEAAARAFLLNHGHQEGPLSVMGESDFGGAQPVIRVSQVL